MVGLAQIVHEDPPNEVIYCHSANPESALLFKRHSFDF